MGKNKKVITRREVAELVKDNATLAMSTFGLSGLPEDLLVALEERYAEEGHPQNITAVWSSGIGNNQPGRGADHLVADGLVKRVIAGHVGSSPKMVEKVVNNEVEAYLFPQGVFTQLYRAIGSHKPYLTKVGLQTYVDPRLEGARATACTKEDLVELVEVNGEEWLQYPDLDIDVAFIRGTYADQKGNLTVEDEIGILEQLELALATKRKGGIVVAQIKAVVENNTLDPKAVLVPGGLIDYLEVCEEEEHHFQTMGTYYKAEFANKIHVPVGNKGPVKLSAKKVINRRAAMELLPNSVINLGIGIPDMVAHVAAEEGVSDEYVTTLELGVWGGTPAGGLDFGSSLNAEAVLPMANQFDFYDGGGLGLSVLGIGQIDQYGNNNVTKFGPKVPGPGGFVNISQNTKNLVFVGTFTVGGKAHVEDGKLVIDNQGRGPKFVKEVEQVSFSGKYAAENDQHVLYVTERAVFDLHEGKVRLIEIASGIDLKGDVLDKMDFEPEIAEDLKTMDAGLFQEEWGGLKAYLDAKK